MYTFLGAKQYKRVLTSMCRSVHGVTAAMKTLSRFADGFAAGFLLSVGGLVDWGDGCHGGVVSMAARVRSRVILIIGAFLLGRLRRIEWTR